MTNTSLVKAVEFAKLGLFLTLGNITPRFLLLDLAILEEDVAVIGVVELVGLFEGEATDDIDDVVDKGGAAVDSIDVAGISVAKSSVTYLGINDVSKRLLVYIDKSTNYRRCIIFLLLENNFNERKKNVCAKLCHELSCIIL